MTNEAAAVRAYDLRRFLCRLLGDPGNSSPQVSQPPRKVRDPRTGIFDRYRDVFLPLESRDLLGAKAAPSSANYLPPISWRIETPPRKCDRYRD